MSLNGSDTHKIRFLLRIEKELICSHGRALASGGDIIGSSDPIWGSEITRSGV